MAICKECGEKNPDGRKFCTGCGKELKAGGKAQKTKAAPPGAPPIGSPYALMGIGGYIGMMFLFAIPIAGLLICIIMAIASSNINRRTYARATLVMVLIVLVLSLIMYLLRPYMWRFASGFIPPFFMF